MATEQVRNAKTKKKLTLMFEEALQTMHTLKRVE